MWSIFAVIIIGVIAAAVMYGGNQAAPITDSTELTEDQQALLEVRPDDHVLGAATSTVTVVEYSDFQCPACRSFEPEVTKLLETYEGQVSVVYRHLPLRQIHPNADMAARASVAAANQGAFKAMHDLLFENQDSWSSERNPSATFESYAESLGLDMDQFSADLASEEVRDRVNRDYQDAVALLGANRLATPTIFVNGTRLSGNELGQIEMIVGDYLESPEQDSPTSTEAVEEEDTSMES